jgi:hypothetical protein
VEDVPDPVKVGAGFATYQTKVEIVGAKGLAPTPDSWTPDS